MRNLLNRIVAAAAALSLVTVVLVFISINPALLYGVPALLWAIAAIIRAINGTGDDRSPRRGSSARQADLADDGDGDVPEIVAPTEE